MQNRSKRKKTTQTSRTETTEDLKSAYRAVLFLRWTRRRNIEEALVDLLGDVEVLQIKGKNVFVHSTCTLVGWIRLSWRKRKYVALVQKQSSC